MCRDVSGSVTGCLQAGLPLFTASTAPGPAPRPLRSPAGPAHSNVVAAGPVIALPSPPGMKRARRTAKCQVGRWRTARACGGTPRRCCAQIALILGAIHPKPHRLVRLVRRAPPRSSWSPGSDFLCHLGLLAVLGYPHQDQLQWPSATSGAARQTNECTRPAERDQLSSAPVGAALKV